MAQPSVSCLFYLFADSILKDARHKLYQVGIPDTNITVELGPLESLLMMAAIWELIDGQQITYELVVDDDPGPPLPGPDRSGHSWLRRVPDLAGGGGPPRKKENALLFLYREPDSTPPPAGSLAESVLAVLPRKRRVIVTDAVMDWARGRRPIRLDEVLGVARNEAVQHGILHPAPPASAARHWGKLIFPAHSADVTRRRGLRPAFTEAWEAWTDFKVDYPDESAVLDRECGNALYALRPIPNRPYIPSTYSP
jgi:hypothetical protein